MFHQDRLIIPTILFGIALTIGFRYLIVNPGANVLTGDSAQYDEYARNLLTGKGYVCGNKLFAHRPPGYPFFLALIYSTFSYSLLAVKIIQCFLNASTCAVTYLVGKKIGGRKLGLIAGLILSFSTGFFEMPSNIMSEVLFTFLLSLSVLILLPSDKSLLKTGRLICSAILLGFATLVRPVIILLPLFILFWMMGKNGWLRVRVYLSFLIFTLVFLAVLSPWVVRNLKIYHKIVIGTTGGQTFAGGNNIKSRGGWSLQNFKFQDDINEVERDKILYREGIKSLRSLNGWQSIKLLILKIWRLFSPFRPSYDITCGLILPFFVMGLFYFKKSGEFEFSLPFVMICYLLFTTLIFYGSFRMRCPYLPFIAIFTAIGFYQFFSKYSRRYNFIILWVIFNLVIFWMNYSYGVFL